MKKVAMALLVISGITLIIVVVSVKTFPEWLTIPGGILILLGFAFNAVLDAGTKIKGWLDLLFPSEINHRTSEQKKQAKSRISETERTKDNPSHIGHLAHVIQQEQPVKESPFTVISHMRVKRQFHVSATLSNGDVLIAGGYDYDGNPPQETLASVELFSVKSMSVSPHGRMSARRYFTAATFLPNNAVLITGGVGENGETLDSAELYNPLTGSFTLLSPMMIKRRSHTSILLRNGKVLILGGSGGENKQIGSRLTSAEIFNPITNKFSLAGNMKVGRVTEHVPLAVMLKDGKVLIAGGYGPEGQLASVEIYDPEKEEFTQVGSMATKRACHSLTLLPNGKVLIAGGYEDSSGHLITAEIFDPKTGTSTLTDNMNVPHVMHTATLLPNTNGKVLVIGGTIPLAEIYDPNTNTFTEFGKLSESRYGHTVSLLPNGQLLIIGGADNNGHSLSSIEKSNIPYHALQ